MTGSLSTCPEADGNLASRGRQPPEAAAVTLWKYLRRLTPPARYCHSTKCCHHSFALLAFLLSLANVGCGGAKVVNIQGAVTLDGKPLAGATVTFLPVNEKEGRAAGGRTAADGSFRLTTFQTDDGALPGQYRVTVVVPDDDPANVSGGNPMQMDEKAKRAFFSKASPQGRAEAAKRKKKKVSPIPAVYGDPLKTPLQETVPPDRPIQIDLQSTVR